MKDFIEFNDENYLWNSGHVFVYLNGELVENIFIDDTDKSADEIIEEMKEKYNIYKVIEK